MSSVKDSFDIDLLPSLRALAQTELRFVDQLKRPDEVGCAVGFPVYADGDVPSRIEWTREGLTTAGFEAKPGQTLAVPGVDGSLVIIVGLGDIADADADVFREAGAAFARAASSRGNACVVLSDPVPAEFVTALVEGALLARYRYTSFKDAPSSQATLRSLTVAGQGSAEAVQRARAYALATFIARDLTNAPPGHLTPESFAKVAQRLAAESGFEAEVLGLSELDELGCGGIIGVNRGSAIEARLVKLTYTPGEPARDRRLALVGKGITFDSGGLSLKPADSMLEMKMDMGGAAAILGAFASFTEAGVSIPVQAWLPITDNMVSGNSLRVGEVLVARNGKTVEVKNTDAEGRLILMDGLALAAETDPTWIVDIATLTGAQMVALGKDIAAVMGSDAELIERIEEAAANTGEQVWEMPLQKRYMKLLDSGVAELANVGGRLAGAITAGLFLSNFVGDIPWAHLDIAGPMSSDKDDRWLTSGATGFGARLLLKLATEI